jgi:hypothetical protein
MSISLDIQIKTTLPATLTKMKQKLAMLPQEAYKEFYKNTPKGKTGNAKRNTKLRGHTIEADYAYAGVLDKGRHMTNRGMRGSNQAPKGMTKPTVDFLRKRVAQIVRGK